MRFELDGDVADDADPTSQSDWANIFDANGNEVALPPNFLGSQFVRDFTPGSHGDTSTFAGGSKDTLNISTGWECTQANNIGDKTDLLNTYASFFVDPATSDTLLYFGAERFDNSGSGDVSVWFLQDPTVGCVAPASGTAHFTGDHVDGDLLLVASFTKGGQVTEIKVYRWVGGAAGYLDTTPILSGADCRTAGGNDTVCAISNLTPVTPPWPTQDKDDDNVLDMSEFLEGGFNLTELGLDLGCFNKTLVSTRISTSLSSGLADYALGAFVTCNDSNACTVDSCDPAVGCVATPISCDDFNPCTDDSCDPELGCVHVNNSLPCDDGDACTTNDVCGGGACVGGVSPCDDGNPCTDDVCDASDGCAHVNRTGSCDDNNACTADDSCQAGTCAGVDAVTCTAIDQCHDAGTCDPATGECSNPEKPGGTACDDANVCTSGDTCQSGTCSGSAVQDGTSCDDGDACTAGEPGDHCTGGQCVPGSPVVCTAPDDCHEAGTCDPQSGQCSFPTKPSGSACSDGNACTAGDQGDRCDDNGQCVPGSPVVCTATDDCHDVGTCDPQSGQCSQPVKLAGSTCSDDNACTLTDTCDGAGNCTPGAPRECTPDDACHETSVCDVSSGDCVVGPKAVNCDDEACSEDPACVEVCDNCIDDNDDGLVDRDDPQCMPLVDGLGAGLGDPRGRGKAVAKCQATMRSVGLRFANTTHKRLQKCSNAVFQCIQQKPGNAGCLAKARSRCAKLAAGLVGGPRSLIAKLDAKIHKSCGPKKPGQPPRVSRDDLCAPEGLGFVGEVEACDDPSTPDADVLDAVVENLVHEHRCRVAQLFTASAPRGGELLTLADIGVAAGECMEHVAEGSSLGLGSPKTVGRAATKCQKAIGSHTSRFFKRVVGSYQKCADGVFKCIQRKPGDARCRVKAEAKCRKLTAGLFNGARSAEGRLRKGIAKACGASRPGATPRLAFEDVRDVIGIGYEALESRCGALGVSSLDSLDAVDECVVREYLCRANQVLTSEMPRSHELLDLGGAIQR